MAAPPTLACVSPAELTTAVCKAAVADDRKLILITRAERMRGADPFGLDGLTRNLTGRAEAVLLIVPKRMGARRAAPACVINGMPVGLLFADRAEELDSWRDALALQSRGSNAWAVLAMRKEGYLRRARGFLKELRRPAASVRPPLRSWLGDEVTPWELTDRLATGPRFVIYFGHATPAGFSGYLGLDWEWMAATPIDAPCGAVLCFACAALRGGGRPPFGQRWVQEGRAGAFCGSIRATSTTGNAALSALLPEILRGSHAAVGALESPTAAPRRIGEVLAELARIASASGSPAAAAFTDYRLVGDPLQLIRSVR